MRRGSVTFGLLLGVWGLVACSSGGGDATPATTAVPPSTGGEAVDGIEGVRVIPAPSRDHVETPVQYETSPPAGGAHFPVWQTCGFYSVVIPEETAVHSLEHGAVWVTYRPDAPAGELADLEALVARATHLLASPYDQASPFVVTAWEHQLDLESLTDPRFGQFVETYLERGPELGATCAGGIGRPPDDPTASP